MIKIKLIDDHFLPHCGVNIEFTLSAGQLVTFVGENGVGKTTLAKRVWQELRHDSTIVEQSPLDIFYDRSLLKVKEIFLHARKHAIDEKFFLELWERFGLSKKESRMHSTLSGGEGQLLKLCLSLSQTAKSYILDEPSQYLDHQMKEVLSKVIQQLLEQGKSILLIEHDYQWVKVPSSFIQLEVQAGMLKEARRWNT